MPQLGICDDDKLTDDERDEIELRPGHPARAARMLERKRLRGILTHPAFFPLGKAAFKIAFETDLDADQACSVLTNLAQDLRLPSLAVVGQDGKLTKVSPVSKQRRGVGVHFVGLGMGDEPGGPKDVA